MEFDGDFGGASSRLVLNACMRILFTLLSLTFCVALCAQETKKKKPKQPKAPPEGVEVIRDIAYKKVGDLQLLADLYRPKEFEGELPTVIWVHGGGWKNGSKNNCKASWLAQHGFAVLSINYRLTDVAQWPSQIDDCYAAVRWVRSRGGEHHLSAGKVGAFGSSAGGHLVALMGTRAYPKEEDVSSRVQAVCDWFGPSELLSMPPNNVGDVANSNGAKLLGATVREVPDLAKDASALDQVSADDAAFLIMHGDEDKGVPLEQSEKLHAALAAAGVESTLNVIEGAGHGGKLFETEEVRAQIVEFFSKHLR